MKHFIFILLICNYFTVTAQLEITTNSKEDFAWKENDTSWNSYFQETTTAYFHFNKDLTEFTQISISEKVNYCILKWDYDQDSIKYTMRIVNDAGDEFELWVDGINKQVVLFYWKKQKYFMTKFNITAMDLNK